MQEHARLREGKLKEKYQSHHPRIDSILIGDVDLNIEYIEILESTLTMTLRHEEGF